MRTPRRTTIALVSGVSAVAALTSCSSGAASPDTADEAAEQPSEAAVVEEPAAPEYADGTYTATGSYESPAGPETVGVSITLADGMVSAVEVTPEATNPASQKFQTQFASGVADVVVGQPIEGLTVDAVSGSSLTPEGFNAALVEIAADAHA
ncbi:FMN-binding protein [Cellulomonas xylanilytica]|uniref:Uncharacterized protein n=1 Tax=Cellulomonas xylanilytica TaxID=233583 RepID=A0A510UY49_9CELL|nr:FMN-binding protein [Cellulomonas xylanilytica]GEK19612.1 hypothetical protein CXY01_01320 [Cellulomonas xylanilytica]